MSRSPVEIYFETRLDIDAFASWLRTTINLPTVNQSAAQRDQRRHSLNYRETYYLFEVLGFELYLIQNLGETAIPERSDHALYMIVWSDDTEVSEQLANHLRGVIEAAGVPAVVDSLSA